MNRPEAPLLDASTRLDQIPADGRDIDVRSTAEQREAIAQRLAIGAVDALTADLHLERFRGGLRLRGEIDAVVEQACVVSGVPVTQRIKEDVDRIFLPVSERPADKPAGSEVFVDLETDDLPDYFEGHEIDLADAIIETVALALDPYPRAPGATLADAGLKEEDPIESPFAALRRLVDPKEE
jgi:uncharacterized metal-binding protein YceD (DUF177 family)